MNTNYVPTIKHIKALTDLNCGAAVISPSEDPKELLTKLEKEIEKFDFVPSVATTRSGVIQKFEAFADFAPESIWAKIGQEISENLRSGFESLRYASLFATPLDVSDLTLQYYPQSKPEDSYALSAHRDQSGFLNLVVVLLVRGSSAFFICKDRVGTTPIEPVEIKANIGDLIILRAGGFGGGLPRPCHFVGRIENPEGRVSFALRQVTKDADQVKKLEIFFGKKF
jgi:hypothetical protein